MRRGTHGLRRMVAGEVYDATLNPLAAMEFIGDTSIRMAETYIKRRLDRVRAAALATDHLQSQHRASTASVVDIALCIPSCATGVP